MIVVELFDQNQYSGCFCQIATNLCIKNFPNWIFVELLDQKKSPDSQFPIGKSPIFLCKTWNRPRTHLIELEEFVDKKNQSLNMSQMRCGRLWEQESFWE